MSGYRVPALKTMYRVAGWQHGASALKYTLHHTLADAAAQAQAYIDSHGTELRRVPTDPDYSSLDATAPAEDTIFMHNDCHRPREERPTVITWCIGKRYNEDDDTGFVASIEALVMSEDIDFTNRI